MVRPPPPRLYFVSIASITARAAQESARQSVQRLATTLITLRLVAAGVSRPTCRKAQRVRAGTRPCQFAPPAAASLAHPLAQQAKSKTRTSVVAAELLVASGVLECCTRRRAGQVDCPSCKKLRQKSCKRLTGAAGAAQSIPARGGTTGSHTRQSRRSSQGAGVDSNHVTCERTLGTPRSSEQHAQP